MTPPARSPVDDALDRLYVMADRAAGKDVRAADLAAITTISKELEQLREERDAAEKRANDSHEVMVRVYARAESAEAEVQRLTEGLRVLYGIYPAPVAKVCDEIIDRSGGLLGRLRASPGWPTLTAGDQGERPDGSGRVAPADGCAERQSTADPSPAASVGGAK